ncbi:protease SohB [Bermanella marisrubri]|uniref:protease SohB n=1 Tax=Bermanella marisrubri TaxID=207949 RepID=UPI001442B06B|nr:protease SohB [Bermanella marisrubri]QIZ84233.1 protease SohB [Bermanella marisrubri]
MEFLADYGLFLAKAITVVVTIGLIIGLIVSAGQKGEPGKLKVEKLNEKLNKVKQRLESELLDKKALKEKAKALKKSAKKEKSEEATKKARVIVLDFKGDIKASASQQLREEITTILSLEEEIDEVVVRLESAGGMVHEYGFAASQLDRIRARGIPLTIAVDKVAASGGYMMAVVADRIIAAPFAVIGSIGVVAQLPNFHRLLKKHDIDVEMHTAGEYKRTLTVLGENTDKAREKFKEDLQDVHVLFKDYINSHRPNVDIEKVSNGDVWFGQRAIDQNLIDEIMTSDEYLQSKCSDADVFSISLKKKKSIKEKFSGDAESMLSRVVQNTIERLMHNKWFV